MAKWTGVITNAGAELLQGWAAGKTLSVTGAEAGSGIAAEAALMAQTTVAGGGRSASITGRKELKEAVQLRVQIAAPEEGYILHQIGIWAVLDGRETVLLALYQNLEGVPISSKADSPDFAFVFYGIISLHNNGRIDIAVDGEAWVTIETLNEAIDSAAADITKKITAAKEEALREAATAADEKIAEHDMVEDAHAGQFAAWKAQTAAEVIYGIMTNQLTLPLAADDGEALLASGGTPLLAVYHPNQNAAALAAVEALAGELSGRIAAAKAEAAGEAVTAADVKIRAAVAAHNGAEAAHPTHLSVIKKS